MLNLTGQEIPAHEPAIYNHERNHSRSDNDRTRSCPCPITLATAPGDRTRFVWLWLRHAGFIRVHLRRSVALDIFRGSKNAMPPRIGKFRARKMAILGRSVFLERQKSRFFPESGHGEPVISMSESEAKFGRPNIAISRSQSPVTPAFGLKYQFARRITGSNVAPFGPHRC